MTQASQGLPISCQRVFLSTEWRDLLMLNYEIDPAVAKPFVPAGTELDSFEGKYYVSLVGLRFANTKLFGAIKVPFHANFDEVNLRTYVRRNPSDEIRRGVVFIREIVPLPVVSFVARAVYGENYVSLPMNHSIALNADGGSVEYRWTSGGQPLRLYAQTTGSPARANEGSLEQFISEHYWGYSRRRTDSIEYHVTHDSWHVWTATDAGFNGDGESLYGPGFGGILARRPESAFIADGSPVLVFVGRRIR